MRNEIIIKVKSLYPDLTKSEKKVAMFVNENLFQISYLSIGDLASQCEVGETTILRFCKRLGFSGYYEFKQQVILQYQKDEKNHLEEENKTIATIQTMMDETNQLIDEDKIKEAAQMILESRTLFLFGSGFSGLTTKAAQVRFASLGCRCIIADDKYLKILTANVMDEQDVAIGFSISGENVSTIESVSLAKNNGAKVIAMTNHEESSLAKLGNVVLLTAGKEMGRVGSTLVTEMSQFIVLEVLFQALHDLNKESIDELNYKVSSYIRGE